jgi:hypothetical protein
MSVLHSFEFVLSYFVLWAVLLRALLTKAQVAPRSCGRCGRLFERRSLGEPVCRCS